jgi:hypothetical protein
MLGRIGEFRRFDSERLRLDETVPKIILAMRQNSVPSQGQPTRQFGEIEEGEEFTRQTDDGREADFRLANHRLQPLGHLTAARKLSINEIATYASAD